MSDELNLSGWIIELACCTQTLLHQVSMREVTQPMLAETYAMAMLSSEETDWHAVNEAIIARWSFSGLNRVREIAAHKLAREIVAKEQGEETA